MPNIAALITVAAVMFAVLGAITLIAHIYNLNNIKSKTVGDGQHGTARWANKAEIRKTYRHIPFTPKKWRRQAKQNQTPTMTAIAPRKLLGKKTEPTEEALPQGIVVGCKGGKHSTTAMIDTGDVHVLMIGAAGVMSTALSRLNAFLDTELEQLLCFDTEIDAETFCNEKSAIFVIMPEENPNTFFMISLIIQQLYREILAVADENGGKLKNRCVFFCDEFGTLPKIESAEMMFSASRSRRLQIVPIIQSFAQLEKNYGKEGAEIIVDNTQDTIFGGFAPNSSSAETLSKALGSRTVMSGSVSRSKNDPSQSLQMIERPLLTPDELKSLPKGDFIVMKTGVHPMRVHLKLFFKWGIEFDKDNPYTVPDQGNREVKYADKKEIQNGIIEKYPPEWKEETPVPSDADGGGQAQQDSPKNEPQRTPPKSEKRGGNPIRTSPPKKEAAPDVTEAEIIKDLTETEVHSNEPS